MLCFFSHLAYVDTGGLDCGLYSVWVSIISPECTKMKLYQIILSIFIMFDFKPHKLC